jgi:hypothetical protein
VLSLIDAQQIRNFFLESGYSEGRTAGLLANVHEGEKIIEGRVTVELAPDKIRYLVTVK